MATTKFPKIRRQYHSIYGLDKGLDFSKPSTMIDEKGTVDCSEVVFRRHTVGKAKGTTYFASTDTTPLSGVGMRLDQYYKTTGADKLIAHTTTHTYAYNSTTGLFEDITRAALTGDEDNFFTSEIQNNYYIFNNGIQPIEYWDMSAATTATLTGATTLAAKKIGKYGERLVSFHVIDTGTAYPQRVQWTIVGGVSTPPVATDWSATGSGSTDLEEVMGVDFIQNAEKLGNYYAIYGERTIVLMDYTGRVSAPFSFYTRVSGIGLAAPRAIVNLGNEHIFLGWDDVYSYKGGKEAIRIGGGIRDELFKIVAPQYVNRCFMTFIEETDEIRLYYPTTDATTPNRYFSYNLENRAWSRGVRSYTGFGYYSVVTATTWDTDGEATDTWDEDVGRWDDVVSEALSPINLYLTSDGKIHEDNETALDLVGTAIDGWWTTKDIVVGDRYQATITNFLEFNFEALGNSVDVSHSDDKGATWSTVETFTLTSAWEKYRYDFECNSEMIRFRFRNANKGETFEVRWIEPGFIEGSDR